MRIKKPPEDHWKKRFPELEEELLDTYYKFKGWNKEGIPTQESLHELGLDYVSEDFIKRGILLDDEDEKRIGNSASIVKIGFQRFQSETT
jgi:hypothetical protein